jgi:hypothetical protein
MQDINRARPFVRNARCVHNSGYNAPEGYYIAGFVIYCHTYVDALGVIYRKRT